MLKSVDDSPEERVPLSRDRVLRGAVAVADAAGIAALTMRSLASELGVAIGVETHDDFSASAVVAELLALTDPGWVGAVWDSHHPHRMGERPEQVYANIGSGRPGRAGDRLRRLRVLTLGPHGYPRLMTGTVAW